MVVYFVLVVSHWVCRLATLHQTSMPSLYGRHRALNFPYNAVLQGSLTGRDHALHLASWPLLIGMGWINKPGYLVNWRGAELTSTSPVNRPTLPHHESLQLVVRLCHTTIPSNWLSDSATAYTQRQEETWLLNLYVVYVLSAVITWSSKTCDQLKIQGIRAH